MFHIKLGHLGGGGEGMLKNALKQSDVSGISVCVPSSVIIFPEWCVCFCFVVFFCLFVFLMLFSEYREMNSLNRNLKDPLSRADIVRYFL